MFDEKMKVAYEKSDELCNFLNYEDNQMISTQKIFDAVKENYCDKIDLSFVSFSECGIEKPYGAMMKTILDDENRIVCANIVLNSDNDPKFQRFSLLHELGHLVTEAWQKVDIYRSKESKYVVSTHINYKITSISKEDYEDSVYLTNEQISNIFALRVLMPFSQFYKKVEETNNITEIANFFGVPKDAVVSRMMIGA